MDHFHFRDTATADNFPSSREGSPLGSPASLLYAPFILVRAANANAAITLEIEGAGEAQVMIIRNAQTQLVTTVLNKARPNFISKGNSKYSSLQLWALTIYRPLTRTHEEYSFASPLSDECFRRRVTLRLLS
jgi:hypothetical protein